MKKLILFITLISTNCFADFVNYSVPVKNPDLAPYATMKINLDCKRVEGNTIVSYTLPTILTGVSNKIVMIGDNAAQKFSGELANMTCDSQQCQVKFQNLKIDGYLAQKEIAGISANRDEMRARDEVQYVFGSDPRGILQFQAHEYCH